jgi:hypothetical protein
VDGGAVVCSVVVVTGLRCGGCADSCAAEGVGGGGLYWVIVVMMTEAITKKYAACGWVGWVVCRSKTQVQFQKPPHAKPLPAISLPKRKAHKTYLVQPGNEPNSADRFPPHSTRTLRPLLIPFLVLVDDIKQEKHRLVVIFVNLVVY